MKGTANTIIFILVILINLWGRVEYSRSQTNQSSTQPKPNAVKVELADLIERIEPAIVQIKIDDGLGSGFVVESSGLIVTNYHVIENATRATAIFKNGLSADIKGYIAINKGMDLALLRTKTDAKFPSIEIADKLPRKGDEVIAFGAPKGFTFTVSQGIISAIRRGDEVREIFRDTTGKDIYQFLGYDDSATWIQTTAAISQGNSGGPLVGMDGKVIGINTWGDPRGQNLNFAISSTKVISLLKKDANKKPRELASLISPKNSLSKHPKNDFLGIESTRVNINLPSGVQFTEVMLQIPKGWKEKLFPGNSPIFVWKYPNDEIEGIFTYDKGKLDGPAVTLYEDGHLCTLANYCQNDLDGPFRMFDENKHRLLYAEYKRDKKWGIVCMFHKGEPRLIQNWDKGKIKEEYLVAFAGDLHRLIPFQEFRDQDLQDYNIIKKKLNELEIELQNKELRFKKLLVEYFRKEDERIKQERFSATAPDRRKAQREREQARKEREAAAMESLYRAAVGRSGF
jgi:S1-C subfamily serine protease